MKTNPWIILFALILAMFIFWYCFPLTENQKTNIAQEELQYLFDEDKIDTSLFAGPVSIEDQNKTWFQWIYVEKSDSLIIRIYIPRFRILSNDHYMLGKETLWEKVYETQMR